MYPICNIVDIRVSIAVNDMDRTKQIYRDVFGFTIDGEKKRFQLNARL